MPSSNTPPNHPAPFSGRSTYTNHNTRAARSVTLLTWLAYSLLCSLQPATAATQEYIEDSDHFPGWKGELPRETGELSDGKIQVISYGSLGKVEWTGAVEQLSWKPRIFRYKGFLSDEECDHLIKKGSAGLTPSEVIDSTTGKAMNDSVRTSSGFFYELGEDKIISRIERRLSYISFLPAEHGEGLQILKYINGQKYGAHHDFFWDEVNNDPKTGGQRIVTVLMYLTTPEEGGETVFPRGTPKSEGAGWSDCAKTGLSVKSTRGDAVMFYSLLPNGTTDIMSEHGSCPTLKGEKYSATKWIHVGPVSTDDGDSPCADLASDCGIWSAAGECEKNAKYMLKNCRKSCRGCSSPEAVPSDGTGSARKLLETVEAAATEDMGDGWSAKELEDFEKFDFASLESDHEPKNLSAEGLVE